LRFTDADGTETARQETQRAVMKGRSQGREDSPGCSVDARFT